MLSLPTLGRWYKHMTYQTGAEDLPLEHLLKRLAFRHLRLVIKVAEERNLVGAAKRLNMTQPAVTKALREIESMLGVDLFERTNRGVVPTIYGEALVAHARLVLTDLSRAAEEITDLRDGTGGRVAVGTLLAASATLLPDAIVKLKQERPKLAISIKEGTNDLLLSGLRQGELDLVLGRLPQLWDCEGLEQETLFQDAGCVVVRAGHPLVGRNDLGLHDLLTLDWILPRQQTTLRRQIDLAFFDEGLAPPSNAVESVSLLTNRALIFDAGYVSVWPWQVAQRELQTGRIAILPVRLRPTEGPVGITTRLGGRLSPAAKMLVTMLRKAASEIPSFPVSQDRPVISA